MEMDVNRMRGSMTIMVEYVRLAGQTEVGIICTFRDSLSFCSETHQQMHACQSPFIRLLTTMVLLQVFRCELSRTKSRCSSIAFPSCQSCESSCLRSCLYSQRSESASKPLYNKISDTSTSLYLLLQLLKELPPTTLRHSL